MLVVMRDMACKPLPPAEPVWETCKALQQDISQRLTWDELRLRLQALNKSQLEAEDENHLNIMHYAIKADYTEVVHYLFLRGYFMELQQPSCVPYLHLACFYGRTVIVGIILKERPADFQRGLIPLKQHPCKHAQWGDLELSKLGDYSPLDLAAASGQLRCVKLLLSCRSMHGHALPCILEVAVEHGSAECVRLLLEKDSAEITQSDINRAFKLAVTRKLPECLQLLVARGVEVSEVLNTMNPYHVMYMYSSGYQLHPDRNHGLAECTQVLVDSGMDVNTEYPSGSFPLYSLLHSLVEEMDFSSTGIIDHHMRALECLLKAGANPNLDEESLLDSKYNSAGFFFSFSLGRDPYTSGLSALIALLEQFMNWEGCSVEWWMPCAELLLLHGANPCGMDRYGDTPLHHVMKCLAMQHNEGQLKLCLSPLLRLLLLHGADPDEASSNGLLPVNYYFTLMLTLSNGSSGGDALLERWVRLEAPLQVIQLLQHMKPCLMFSAYTIVSNQFCALAAEDLPKSVMRYVLQEMSKHVHQPRTLCFICSSHIWHCLGRRQANIEALPIPKGLKAFVLSIFEL